MRGRLLRSFLAVLLPALLLLAALQPAPAIQPDEMLADPALEQRARELGKELRCLVCQNQSLVDSPAGLAGDLRHELETMILQRRSDDEIKGFMVERYGDFVLFRPSMQGSNWVLWLGPFAFLLGGAFVWTRLRRRSDADVPVDLEQARRRLEASD